MPTYEYMCKECNHKFDRIHKVSDPSPAECPECHGGPIQKVYSSVGIIFKGSGFYVNDYKKGDPGKLAASSPEKPAESTAESATPAPEKKPDSEPAASAAAGAASKSPEQKAA